MVRRNTDEDKDDITAQLQPLVDDDAFLTALSHGEDPSAGEDELAALFLELRSEVEAHMPPAPIIEGADEQAQVISLGAARRRKASPWIAGLVGAAAATVVVTGTGAALYNAEPESPLWEMSTAVFGERTSVVELAGTLDELQIAADNGDIEGTRELLDQARTLIDGLQDSKKPAVEEKKAPKPSITTVTTTVEMTPPAEPNDEHAEREPVEIIETTVTEIAPDAPTVTVTETVVESVIVTTRPPVRENPLPVQPTAPAPAPTHAPGTIEPVEPEPGLSDPQEY